MRYDGHLCDKDTKMKTRQLYIDKIFLRTCMQLAHIGMREVFSLLSEILRTVWIVLRKACTYGLTYMHSCKCINNVLHLLLSDV